MSLLDRLKKLREDGPAEIAFGICSNALLNTDQMDLMSDWPEFSGDFAYPVPSPDYINPEDAYHRTSDDDLWNPEHPYGAARLRLLDFLIDTLENNKDLDT